MLVLPRCVCVCESAFLDSVGVQSIAPCLSEEYMMSRHKVDVSMPNGLFVLPLHFILVLVWCFWESLCSFGHLAISRQQLHYLARLETRTKESKTCASIVWIMGGGMKMAIGMRAPMTDQGLVHGLSLSFYFRTRKMVNYA